MPFDGEENFVVPKKGGFGQADNDKYVMVTGRVSTTPTPTRSVVTSPTREVITPTPTPTPTPAPTPQPTVISTPTRAVSTPAPAPIVEPQPTVISTPTRATTTTFVDTRTAPSPTSSTLGSNTEQIGVGVGTTTIGTPRGGASMETSLADIGISTPRGGATTYEAPVPQLPSRVDTATPRGGTTTLPDVIITAPTTTESVPTPRGGTTLPDVIIPESTITESAPTPRGTTETTIVTPTETSTAVVEEQLPTFPDFNTLTCDGLNAEILRITDIVSTTRFSSSTVANLYNNALANAKNIYTSKCNSGGGNVSSDVVPTFPDFSTLSCIELTSQVSSLSTTMANLKIGIEGQTPTVTQVVASAYINALADAKRNYNSKCVSTSGTDVSVKTETQLPSPIGGGGIGGGIGGGGLGLGEEPTDEIGQVEEAPKSNYSWLWLVLILGGAYMLTRKKK